MSGKRSSGSGGGPSLDVVGWFQDWLGRRRETLGSGRPFGTSVPEKVVLEKREALRGEPGAVSSGVFNSAFRTVVSARGDARASGVDLPADADVDSQPVPVLLPPSRDWSRAPGQQMRRRELLQWLEAWYRETDWETLGNVGEMVRRPWARVGIGAVGCHLNANTTRAGVAGYLALARREGEQLPWWVVPGRRGVINEVAVGMGRIRLRGFYLYTDSIFNTSGRIGGARPGEKRTRGSAKSTKKGMAARLRAAAYRLAE